MVDHTRTTFETDQGSQNVIDSAPADTAASNNHACNECRRRKARCTRELPECSVCKRNGRHCLYARHSRTPLTRKRLTEVEELLRIATQIIAQRLPDVDLEIELERSRNGDSIHDNRTTLTDGDDEEHATRGAKRQRGFSSDHQTEKVVPEHRKADHSVPSLYRDGTYIEGFGSPHEHVILALEDDSSPELALSNEPSTNLDYDWDERHSEAAIGLDGMASLSLCDEKPGYVGLASGATLLNLIQSYTSDPFASIRLPQQTAGMPDLQYSPTRARVDLAKDIPSHKIAQYITDYFNTFHISYPLVHQGLFMAQYHEIVPRPTTGWVVLMYIVAAIGAFMAATTHHDDDLVLFNLARSHLSVEMLEVGNINLVQSLTLISNYLQKRDRPNSGYNYLGLAVRMAFGLGLHKEFPSWQTNLLQSEMRRRVWWCLYIFDAGSTITYSRPLGIPSTGIDARLPLNTFDSDLNAGTKIYPPNSSSPTIYTNVRVQSKFHLLTNTLYSRIISKPCPPAKDVLAWDDVYIGRWLESVPEYYKDDSSVPERHALAHAIMIWRYKNLRMILYRPFLIQKALLSSRDNLHDRRSRDSSYNSDGDTRQHGRWEPSGLSYNDEACRRCRKESNETIRHIDQYWKNFSHTRMASWYALFFIIPAVLVPLMSLRNEPQSPAANLWREDIIIASQLIRSMTQLNPSANRFLQVLERLCVGFLMDESMQSQQSLHGEQYAQQPIDESPITQMLSVRSLMFHDMPSSFGFEGQFHFGNEDPSLLGAVTGDMYAWPDNWNSANTNG